MPFLLNGTSDVVNLNRMVQKTSLKEILLLGPIFLLVPCLIGGRLLEFAIVPIYPKFSDKNADYLALAARIMNLVLTLSLFVFFLTVPVKFALLIFFVVAPVYVIWALLAMRRGAAGSIGEMFMGIHMLVLLTLALISRHSFH